LFKMVLNKYSTYNKILVPCLDNVNDLITMLYTEPVCTAMIVAKKSLGTANANSMILSDDEG